MQDGTLNEYFYLSLLAPALIMIIGSLCRNETLFVCAVLTSLAVTYYFCILAVDRKWDIRNATAVTDLDRERASADGANRVFARILIGPIQAIFCTAFWGLLGQGLRALIIGNKTSRITIATKTD